MRGHFHFHRALVALAASLAAVALALVVPAAQASNHYPPGTDKLSKSDIQHTDGIVCGKPGSQWLPGVLFHHLWFLSFMKDAKDLKKDANNASGKQAKHDLSLSKTDGKKAKTDAPICKALSQTSGGALASMGPEPAPSIFGINHGTFDSVSSNYTKDEPAAKSLGSRWDIEVLSSATDSGNWTSTDYWVKQARSNGMGVILSFSGIPSACSGSSSNVSGCAPTSQTDLSNYEAYIEKVLARYHSVVDYYESWREPNHGGRWSGNANPTQYAALLKAQYDAFQKFNSQHPNSGPGGHPMMLLFGSVNGFTTTQPSENQPNGNGDMAALPFVHQVLDALAGMKAFDGVALHAYRYPPSNGPNDLAQDYVGTVPYPNQGCLPVSGSCRMTWSQELSAIEQEFLNHGYGPVSMWLTQFGWPGGADPNSSNCQAQPGYCPSEQAQDADLKAAYADLLQLAFVKGALWFNVRDYQPGVASTDPWFFFYYGLLNYDYSHKAAADDFKALAAANPNR